MIFVRYAPYQYRFARRVWRGVAVVENDLLHWFLKAHLGVRGEGRE